jgi:hypothetical protein
MNLLINHQLSTKPLTATVGGIVDRFQGFIIRRWRRRLSRSFALRRSSRPAIRIVRSPKPGGQSCCAPILALCIRILRSSSEVGLGVIRHDGR